jgi:hypothetical protein
LAPGTWKPLTGEERAQLFQAVGRGSSHGEVQVGKPEVSDSGHRTGGGATGQ